mmetsp:Transcript_64150/g.165127  ORF Transcript_64150/g.165127 Transcript_64150/m.165127 type:complete len:370 (+) Transcript_64150:167-1276(+)
MQGGKGGGDVGVNPPPVTVVVVGLATLYASICGLCSLCPGPTAVLLCAVLVLAELFAGARLFDPRHPTVPYLVVLWTLTIGAASVVGIRNHHAAYYPYRAAMEGRTYTGIAPSAKASAHADGGIIRFADGAQLMTDQSVGLRFDGVVYCAAPILGPEAAPATAAATPAAAPAAAPSATVAAATPAAATSEVQFFAIGEGCCGARGGFACDDAGSARGGIVWHEPGEGSLSSRLFAPSSHRPQYMKSVLASMSLSDQRSAPQPVLLRWVSDPQMLLRMWLTQGLLVWIVTSLVYSVFVLVLWFLVDFHFDRALRGNVSDVITGRPDHHHHLRPPPSDTSTQKGAPGASAAAASQRFGMFRSSARRRDGLV